MLPKDKSKIPEYKEKLAKARRGKPGWMLGRKNPKSEELKRKMSLIMKGRPSPMKGRKWTDEQREKIVGTRTGKKHPRYKERMIEKRGYIVVHAEDSPNGDRHGHIFEHRKIMERHLGRPLKKDEFIHHKNGVKSDNRIENLQVVKKKSHCGRVECPFCKKEFLIR